jgi:protease I
MGIIGKKVAVLVDDYFEQAEFEEPIEALRDAGVEVEVIATKNKKIHGLNHVDKGDTFTADLLLDEATPEDYDALVLPGGAINADALRMVEAAQLWVRDFLEEDRPVAVICHAPWVLVSADLLDGRRLTSFETIQDDIQNAGGDWVNEPVVIDGSLITSRKPDDLPAFNEALIKMLHEGLPVETADAVQTSKKDVDDPVVNEHATEDEARLRELGYNKQRDDIDLADVHDIH